MSERALKHRVGPDARVRARQARAAAFALLLVAGVSLSGCGSLKFLGGKKDVTAHAAKSAKTAKAAKAAKTPKAPKPPDSDEPRNIGEARERVASFPGDPYWRYRLGQFQMSADSLPAAEATLRSALARDANHAPALAQLSKLYYQTGRHEEGVRLLEPARTRPDAFTEEARQALMAGMALHLDALGRPDLAGATIPPVAGADLERTGPAMVYVALRGEQAGSAGDLAKATLREDSRSAVNLNNYGITRAKAGDPKAARKAFMDAIERDPKLPGPYYNLAILEKYYLMDDQAAGRWFRDYWQRSHDDPDNLRSVFANDAPKPVAQKDEAR